MSEFAVGMKVICINDDPNLCCCPDEKLPDVIWDLLKGTIYTVRWVGMHQTEYEAYPSLSLRVEEINRETEVYLDTPFLARRFRPLESRAIQLFRDIAAGKHIVPDDEPIRVPAPVEGWTVESLTADILRRAV